MQRMANSEGETMKTTIRLLTAIMLVISVPLALADGHGKTPNIGSVWIISAKDGVAGGDFENAMKTHMAWRKEAGDPRNWQVYTIDVGGDRSEYYIRACCFNWADQDSYERWAYDNGVYEAYAEQLGVHVGEIRHNFQSFDMDNSNWDDSKGPYYYIGVTVWTPNPAKNMQRYGAVNEMSSLAKDKGWPYNWAWFNTVGGPDNLSLAIPNRNFADMEPPEKNFYDFASEHMGEEEAQAMFQRFDESFWGSKYTIYRWREDLSMKADED